MRTKASAALVASAVALSVASCGVEAAEPRAAGSVTASTSTRTTGTSSRHLLQSKEERQRIIKERNLAIDFYDDDMDECYNEETDKYEKCDLTRFPQCSSNELICYNRTNRRDKFYDDWHPRFYINYNRVMCYPASWEGWGGCSSCSPGRYCKHEQRCILDEGKYCCEGEWGCNTDEVDNDGGGVGVNVP
mmetsp:Transcript_22447/g.48757  ORF Transcript_22447/g.48757 Transcript_22447/m.48757 type:complete len:190 (-) Transcript_22447:193-762(-)